MQLPLINIFFYYKFGSLTESQILSPEWPEIGLLEPNRAQIGRKRDFQKPRLILHSFYVQLLLINLVLILNCVD